MAKNIQDQNDLMKKISHSIIQEKTKCVSIKYHNNKINNIELFRTQISQHFNDLKILSSCPLQYIDATGNFTGFIPIISDIIDSFFPDDNLRVKLNEIIKQPPVTFIRLAQFLEECIKRIIEQTQNYDRNLFVIILPRLEIHPIQNEDLNFSLSWIRSLINYIQFSQPTYDCKKKTINPKPSSVLSLIFFLSTDFYHRIACCEGFPERLAPQYNLEDFTWI